jgi:cytochrome P450
MMHYDSRPVLSHFRPSASPNTAWKTIRMFSPLAATDLLSRTILENPYPLYTRLRQEAPVWQVPGTRIFVVTDYDRIDEATRRTGDFSSNLSSILFRNRKGLPARLKHGIREMGQFLATADQPVHKQHKAIIAPLFSPRRIAAMQAEVESVATDYIGKALAKTRVEFMSEIANPVPMKVVSDFVGFPTEDIDRLLKAAFDSTAIVGASLTLWELLRCLARSAAIQFWLNRQLDIVPSTGDKIISRLKSSVEEGGLTKAAARGILHTFLAAGGESTASHIGSALRILAEDPELQHKLRANPGLIARFLEEVLRVESPFRCHLRSVWRDTTLGGVDIPADSTVLLFWAAGNRDADVFSEPEALDIDRPKRHMAFGRGIHTCIGAPLARLEARIVIEQMLAQTTSIALDPASPSQWVPSLQVRRLHTLPLLVSRR